MDSVLWLVGSLVLLVPIIYLLPLGLTKKGKMVTVCTAFFVSLLGQMVVVLYNSTISIMLLLTVLLLATYIIHNRLAPTMYLLPTSVDELGEEKDMEEYLELYQKPKVDLFVEDDSLRTTVKSNQELNLKTLTEGTVDLRNDQDLSTDDSLVEDEISLLWDREVELKFNENLVQNGDEESKPFFKTEEDFGEVYDVDWSLLEANENLNSDVEREKQLV
ncbi:MULTISPECIES: hypothetical protein [unclassified Bacillus (in: firmicutes)]|uniref:hypothetical protein n=1 Tax=unclassified Bacillus (in: firmicutes) TaxID=185979 RepID=UPI0008E3D50D|nr:MULTISPECIES: hypothetical protein [unclassified Bacillus (in: firmicutes)]SFB16344.1 hypothetical protein SAMN02799634_10734 [Bacillus sp. UNCCL13]SFQ78111.1 hypothetical protein SAMN04488577_1604 [Bacillus sp. cl95]